FYLDIIKDRQYTAKADSVARRSCQTALYHIVEALVRWMAPITSFTAQEIWQELPGDRAKFVFTETWYQGFNDFGQDDTFNDAYWKQVMAVKDAVNQALEQARKAQLLGGSLEASVTLYADDTLKEQLELLADELRFVLLTSGVEVAALADKPADATATELEGLFVSVAKSSGEKCARCWHVRDDVGSHSEHPELCGRCVTNVDGDGETRHYA
ncbi:MAG TPA: isoleucine--tRNA ligase, partial [Alteromonas sp.]|nr:isoleucine--tRNA ligase [Alteromonas sp.]